MKNAVMVPAVGLLCLISIALYVFVLSPWGDEVARIRSPDGFADAIIRESSGGATTSFSYEIYVVPAKTSPFWFKQYVFRLYDATRNNRAYGVSVLWEDNQTLMVRYYRGQITAQPRPIAMRGKPIRIHVVDGYFDPAAPSGGMWANLSTTPAP